MGQQFFADSRWFTVFISKKKTRECCGERWFCDSPHATSLNYPGHFTDGAFTTGAARELHLTLPVSDGSLLVLLRKRQIISPHADVLRSSPRLFDHGMLNKYLWHPLLFRSRRRCTNAVSHIDAVEPRRLGAFGEIAPRCKFLLCTVLD